MMDKLETKAKIYKACGIIFLVSGAGFMAFYIALIRAMSFTGLLAAGYIIAPLAVIIYGFFMFRKSVKIRRDLAEQKGKEGS